MEHTSPTQPLYYSTADICRLLNVSRQWIFENVNKQHFPAPRKIGKLNRYNVEEVNAYIAKIEQEISNETAKN
ncbi:MAG: helix-turn-helix domain-containing protein [Pasteurellaceae bacterium]|nr:helix-turn-helix domain-containing protein [Pasteurellaceae bacterium]